MTLKGRVIELTRTIARIELEGVELPERCCGSLAANADSPGDCPASCAACSLGQETSRLGAAERAVARPFAKRYVEVSLPPGRALSLGDAVVVDIPRGGFGLSLLFSIGLPIALALAVFFCLRLCLGFPDALSLLVALPCLGAAAWGFSRWFKLALPRYQARIRD